MSIRKSSPTLTSRTLRSTSSLRTTTSPGMGSGANSIILNNNITKLFNHVTQYATGLTAVAASLNNLNPMSIAEAAVKEASALYLEDTTGKKTVEDALRDAKQGQAPT
ncbi:hypothetical protein An01g10080 [Aspergillus niger]|uniref:Uncharacterized protein n=2 Tax=Aspergillus niger TaxID=5061 RepID=A2QA38_ASPNC|nr:hypothetical protein An01g10080 [Aspergillus niger]CAK37190.1 hypothetical protein An01g10080 [Aspergillus niger]